MHALLRSSKIINSRCNIVRHCNYCHDNIMYMKRLTWIYDNPAITSHFTSNFIPFLNQNHYRESFNSSMHLQFVRNIHVSTVQYDMGGLKPSSKVEVTVKVIKDQKAKKESDKEIVLSEPPPTKKIAKKTIREKIVSELLHYYHGFRLLFIDIKISSGLVWRILNGKPLTRREHRLLVRTTGDLFRLLPFSVFIIVPFMEFLLPVAIKLFPGMLPSTFQTAKEKEDKVKQNLKMKLEMAKFLQNTLDEMSVQAKDHSSEQAKEFVEWFQKVRTSGENVSNEEILKFSKLFEDEITLDTLSRGQLVALCRVLEVNTLGTNYLLRFQLRMKLRNLAADDKVIQKEGISSLTLSEVQQACRARGMSAYGVSEERLRTQLSQWLDLSLNEKVPPSLLLLSRALMLPESITTGDQLKATISALPEQIVTQTTAAIGESEGKIHNKVQMEVIKEEERRIKEERKERRAQEAAEKKKQDLEEEKKRKEQELRDKEVLVDKAPIIDAAATPSIVDKAEAKKSELESKDMHDLEDAVLQVSKEKKLAVEKEDIQELKEELAEYQEDLQELQMVTADDAKPAVKESVAAKRLFKKVNKMINKMDKALGDLQVKEKQLKIGLENTDLEQPEEIATKEEEILKIDDIMNAIRQIKGINGESKMEQIENILSKIDDDRDGKIKVDDVMKIIEVIGKENVKLTTKQIDEIIDLLEKEEVLEVEGKIEKVLQKEKDSYEAEQAKAQKKSSADEQEQQQQQQQQQENPINATSEDNKSTTNDKIPVKQHLDSSKIIGSIDKNEKKSSQKEL